MKKPSLYIFMKMSFVSLKRHPIRSGLALLGIVIGIASMIVTMALGEGTNERLKKEILAMGENWIYIIPGNFVGRKEVKTTKEDYNLQFEDYLALKSLLSDIHTITPSVEENEVVKYEGNQVLAEIKGLNSSIFAIEPRKIKIGVPFTSHHDKAALPVAVLGSETAKILFKHENPIGKTVTIDKYPFLVVGVFTQAPKRINAHKNPDVDVVVPFTSVWKKLIQPGLNNSLQHIIIKPVHGKNSTQLVSTARKLLRFRHQISDGSPDDFSIWDLQAMMEAAHKGTQVLNYFLLIAASVSLIVGGIGIMNVMLVSMTERRKEIGIKMAIGATSGQILAQFLIESVLLCFTGGVVGILIGLGGAFLIGSFSEFDWALKEKPLVIAFGTTVIVGLFFGFYPAYKASKLNPIEALQSS